MDEGVRSFSCDLCDFKASKRSGLKRHTEATHEGLRPYECKLCDLKTTQNSTLRAHVRAIHENNRETYPCIQCDYKATRKSGLTKHVLKVHGENWTGGFDNWEAETVNEDTSKEMLPDLSMRELDPLAVEQPTEIQNSIDMNSSGAKSEEDIRENATNTSFIKCEILDNIKEENESEEDICEYTMENVE